MLDRIITMLGVIELPYLMYYAIPYLNRKLYLIDHRPVNNYGRP